MSDSHWNLVHQHRSGQIHSFTVERYGIVIEYDLVCGSDGEAHTVPRGLSVTGQAHSVVARLIAHLSRGLMPIEVDGDVQWMVNRTHTGWTVALLNPAGQSKHARSRQVV